MPPSLVGITATCSAACRLRSPAPTVPACSSPPGPRARGSHAHSRYCDCGMSRTRLRRFPPFAEQSPARRSGTPANDCGVSLGAARTTTIPVTLQAGQGVARRKMFGTRTISEQDRHGLRFRSARTACAPSRSSPGHAADSPAGESRMSWTRVTAIVCLLLFSASWAQAQQQATGRVTGVVTDVATQRPIPGVNVVLAGTTRGGLTSENGRYLLTGVPAGSYTVQAISIGYQSAEQAIVVSPNQTVVADLQMSTQAVKLQEIVAVGYGTQTRREITGAVASVSTEALEKSVVKSIDQVLQGTSPGVQVTTASSEPGGALSIRIRGTSSITGNSEPLYVIDGFPIENDIEGSSVGNAGRDRTTPPNPLTTLNPSDIESISILKDASATAIYGARGANGVVIVTTKQGRGTRPQFTLDYYRGTQSLARRYDLLDAKGYMDYANEYGANSSNPYTPFPDSVYNRILQSGINTDWQDELFRNAGVQNLQLSLIGASASSTSPTRYALSAGMFDQDGIVLGSGFKRYSTRLNLNQAVGSRVEIGGSFTASMARTQSVPTAGQQNANSGAVSAAIQYVPILPVYRADGTYSYIFSDLNAYNSLLDAPTTPNPISLAREVMDSLGDTRLLGNVFAKATLLPGLEARISLGADNASRWRYTYYSRNTMRGASVNGEAIRATSNTFSWLNENSLTYRKEIGTAHDFTLLGGYTRQAQDVDGENMTNTNFVSDITGYYDIGAGTQEGGPSVSSRKSRQTLQSWLTRLNYSLLDRYLLTLTFRRDGSSRFASGKKWGNFPSAALAWRMSAEPWMQGREWLNELKLRASYGLAGNPSIRPYQSLARLNDQGYAFGGTPYAGYYPVAVGNPDLTWETTRQLDIGVDLGILNRFVLTADWYKKNTTDLLLAINLPFETGFESALTNLGEVENQGFEIGLDARIIEPRDPRGFAWRANINYATNRNKVVDLGGLGTIEADLLTTDYNLPGTHIEVGKPIGYFYGFKSEGVIRDSACSSGTLPAATPSATWCSSRTERSRWTIAPTSAIPRPTSRSASPTRSPGRTSS
ncbi:MAG: SusC/RagA family TonB-linked outer membrane protein [Gemmatimonadetes bacterium]|nr:SusC/RagA family TonB-linked outer membrane protein [Gemmatimonadota bacterium]